MAILKKVVDPIRVKVLSSLRLKGCLSPNVRQIKRVTGFHRATIKSSIDFLEKEKFIQSYRPIIDPITAGYNLYSYAYLQVNLSDKSSFKTLTDAILLDKNALVFSEVVSESNFNITLVSLHKNIEDYYKNIKLKYHQAVPNYFDFVKKTSVNYLTSPIKYKGVSEAIIELLMDEQGVE